MKESTFKVLQSDVYIGALCSNANLLWDVDVSKSTSNLELYFNLSIIYRYLYILLSVAIFGCGHLCVFISPLCACFWKGGYIYF